MGRRWSPTDCSLIELRMQSRLKDLVEGELLQAFPDRSYKVVESKEFDSFGDAIVIAEIGNIRVRFVRDRSQLFADFGSVHTPDATYDSAVVFELLGLSSNAGFHGDDAESELSAVRGFLTAFRSELDGLLGAEQFKETNERLATLRQRQSQRRWG